MARFALFWSKRVDAHALHKLQLVPWHQIPIVPTLRELCQRVGRELRRIDLVHRHLFLQRLQKLHAAQRIYAHDSVGIALHVEAAWRSAATRAQELRCKCALLVLQVPRLGLLVALTLLEQLVIRSTPRLIGVLHST